METQQNVFLSRSFLLSFFSFFFLWISFDFFILFPLYILQKGGDSVDVGLQTFIFFFPAVIMRPVAGWLTDRIGRLRVLYFGSTLMVVTAFGLLTLKGTYHEIKYWTAALLFFRGIAFAAFYTAFFTYIIDLSSSRNRGRVIGMFGVSGLVAHGIAPWVAERVLEHYGFSGFFVTSGALSLVSLMISAFLKEQHQIQEFEETGWTIIRSVTLTIRNLIILPGAFVFGYIVASYNTFGAPYFQKVGVTTGSFFLAYGLTAGTIRVIFGGVADRYQRWKLVTIFFALQASGLLMLLVEPVRDFYLIAGAISGAAHGILFPSLSAMAIDAHPQRFRGLVASIFTGMMEFGFSVGSYILGIVVAFGGYRVMFGSAVGVGLLFAAYVILFHGKAGNVKGETVVIDTGAVKIDN